MPIRVAIRHHTSYHYDRAVKLSPQIIRLRPAPHARNPIVGYSLNIRPANHFINWQQDPFGNYQARVVIPEPTRELSIDVEVITDLVTINPFDFFLEDYAEHFPFAYEEQLRAELAPYLHISETGPLLKAYLALPQVQGALGRRTVDFLVAVNQALAKDIHYNIRMEPGVQACEVTLERRNGSCRDTAWLLVQMLRHLGLAARFVSGYLVQLTPDEKVLDGPNGPEADFTDLHAWAEVYLPGAGWVGLDATSGLFAGEGHIPLAATPEPASAAPLSGYSEPAEVTFEFANVVERIHETPRVTKPYSEHQFAELLALGDRVEQALQAGDVRLTMGGEPTFVSEADMESPQWNEAADGEDKRRLAYDLATRLWKDFAPGGFLHQGQGKWYPGEPIPRWQYAIYWRTDGEILWQNPALLANPTQKGDADHTHAAAFGTALARNLALDPNHLRPAYEDTFYFLWETGNLPFNVDPRRINPADKLERQTLAQLLEVGLDKPKGYVLPLGYDLDADQWISSPWEFRREHLFLLPGNSGMGFRLPLDRLPEFVTQPAEVVVPASPMEDLPPLPGLTSPAPQDFPSTRVRAPYEKSADATASRPRNVRTALCLEPRDGNLYLFLPPLEDNGAYVRLLQAIERTAAELQRPVIIEGYHPAPDPRLTKLVVAPDPGVVEVNVHPATNWRDIVATYTTLFARAQESRLGTNKFMIDGRHTGTGGGNHITLGGTTPANSPLLRRPDLLRSFINFWQNHPGLSYLFSSAFIGPTSQAPRVDEGRQDQLYELEIAFAELDRHPNPPHWLVDRVFRNLLIDVTGNTHRAEFCIDKLYSPDSPTGRLGILEMRGFDMPPHRDMCLAQLLLIRALCAAFWAKPYRRPLVRWGSDLHDKFLLHHYVREDLLEVLWYLREAGFDFKMEWLEPFLEFRFPVLGHLRLQGMALEVRSAIEPWHVLGEELGSAGTARYVDSSAERIQVRMTGLNPDRYALLCNQTVVPLDPTGVQGEYVAGIRYKAWNPPSALHPTIEPDVPLTFDVYDQWNERSIGGCTYHVVHPGGRSYDTFPINSLEAESRRVNRFWAYNHSPRTTEQIIDPAGSAATTTSRYLATNYSPPPAIEVRRLEPKREFAKTLDLRWAEKR
ncbi:transglutaminase family protein [Neolewinella lacunae]|uniref:Transglutaminase family protein n=1 Tax=Neolewinella lacunae TaxID=1517758 RepID=A0A923PJT5_9BACT|nr:transglutaminase family protein [Neolewinella lacunae]MBC6992614.1 transglutaminase family protein [Neolewinella lacunae]MDN3634355.1 transglutaminase family protein [Neolewinella lacunae]